VKNTPILGALFPNIQISPLQETILLEVRLPRIIAGILVGAALSVSGVAYQSMFRNPLADPYVLGVSAGAAAGGSIAIILHVGTALLGPYAISLTAFVGAILASFLVYEMGRVGGRTPVTTLLLAGIATSIFLSAFVTLAVVLSNPYTGELHALIFWLFGSLAGSSWPYLWASLPMILVGILFLAILGRHLNLILLGEEAEQLGLEAEKIKKIIIVLASFVTSAAVAISGIIGFVGLMIPHITRMLVGPDHRVLLPCAALVGAIYLVLFDTVARVIYAPGELPVGVMTALAGGPFFLYLLRRKRGEYAL